MTPRLTAAKHMLTQVLLEESLRRARARRGELRAYGQREREQEARVREAVDRAVDQLAVELGIGA